MVLRDDVRTLQGGEEEGWRHQLGRGEIGGQEPGACVVTALSAIIGRQLQEERLVTHQQLQSGSVSVSRTATIVINQSQSVHSSQ